MDPDIDSLSLDEQISILMADLPVPIRNFLRSPERDAVSLRLSQKYALHADQADAFERAYIYMLLGVYTPDEFVSELRDAGLPDETVRGLATDVNEQVFKRLRGEERSPETQPIYRTLPPAASVPVMQVGAEASPPAAPMVSTVPENLPGQGIGERPAWVMQNAAAGAATDASVPVAAAATSPDMPIQPAHSSPMPIPQAPAQAYAPIYNASQSMPVAVPAYEQHARTMQEDMERAAHGVMGQPATPARSFQTASVPVTYAPAMPTPVAPVPAYPLEPIYAAQMSPAFQPLPAEKRVPYIPQNIATYPPTPSATSVSSAPAQMPYAPAPLPTPTAPTSAPAMTAPIRLTPVDRPQGNAPLTKEYGSDPYREPIA